VRGESVRTLWAWYRTCFDGMGQLDGDCRDKSLPQSMEALRAEPPLAASIY
jgi:hypothetical protein